jgi:hypothetical protein
MHKYSSQMMAMMALSVALLILLLIPQWCYRHILFIVNNSNPNTNPNIDANTNPNIDANTNPNIDANTNPNIDANTNSNIDANTKQMNICLIGNGPLSEIDRTFIESSECGQVWRFNDMKNMNLGERCDGRFVRSNGYNYWGIINPPKFDVTNVPMIAIGESKLNLSPYKQLQKILIDTNIFSNCKDCFNSCSTDKSLNGWAFSSGAIAISYFEGRRDVANLHIFGMNFMFTLGSQHDKNQNVMVDSCCTKCIVHKTYKNTYYP